MDWHPEKIKYELRMAGSNLAIIARELGCNRSQPTRVLMGFRSRRVEKAIASALGTEPRTIWPSRYPNPSLKK